MQPRTSGILAAVGAGSVVAFDFQRPRETRVRKVLAGDVFLHFEHAVLFLFSKLSLNQCW